jgi:hypothetical protein
MNGDNWKIYGISDCNGNYSRDVEKSFDIFRKIILLVLVAKFWVNN